MLRNPENPTDINDLAKHWLQTQLEEPLSLSELETYRPYDSWFKKKENLPKNHDIGHETRVLVLQELLAQLLQNQNPLLQLNRKALRWASVTHDTQRDSDFDDEQHGEAAAVWVMGNNSPVPDDLKSEVSMLNKLHVPRDFPNMPLEAKVLKDADCLDRIRDLQHFDPRFLRFPESLALIPIARELYNLSVLNPNYGDGHSFDSVLQAASDLGLIA